MKKQIEDKMNELGCKTAHKADGTWFQWKGTMPNDVDIVAPFANCFASDKNLKKWLRWAGVDQDTTDLNKMTKNELLEYAESKGLEIELKRKTKEELILEIENGISN